MNMPGCFSSAGVSFVIRVISRLLSSTFCHSTASLRRPAPYAGWKHSSMSSSLPSFGLASIGVK